MNSRYETDQKRCSQCEIFIHWEGKHVPVVVMFSEQNPKARKPGTG